MTNPPPSGPVAFRLRRPYSDADAFLAGDGAAINRNGMVLIGAAARPVGLVIRFEIALRDGAPLFRGEGRVVAHRATAEGDLPAGLEIRFTRLDSRGKSLVDQVVGQRGEAHPSQPPPSHAMPSISPASLPPLSLRSASVRPPLSQPPPTLPSQPAPAVAPHDPLPVIPPLIVPVIDEPAASTEAPALLEPRATLPGIAPPAPGSQAAHDLAPDSPLPISPGDLFDAAFTPSVRKPEVAPRPPAPILPAPSAREATPVPTSVELVDILTADSRQGPGDARPDTKPVGDTTHDPESVDGPTPGNEVKPEPARLEAVPADEAVQTGEAKAASGATSSDGEVASGSERDERLARLRGRGKRAVVPEGRDALLARLRARSYGRRRRRPGGERGRRAR